MARREWNNFKKQFKGRNEQRKNFSTEDGRRRLGKWLDENFDKAQIFILEQGPRIVFGGIKDAFHWQSNFGDRDIFKTITVVAIINAALASLPGKMGAGVLVSMGLEMAMAIMIARSVGLDIKKPRDILTYFSAMSGSFIFITMGFVHLLRGIYSLASLTPLLPALAIAEIIATNITGILFLVGFAECKKASSFRVPVRLYKKIIEETKGLTEYQVELLKSSLSPSNMKRLASAFMEWLKGEKPPVPEKVRGDIFTPLAFYYLMNSSFEQLDGPMGEIFIQAIRLRWSAQFDESSTLDDIAQRFREYETEELPGVVNTIKGKMFEILVEKSETEDGDAWVAKMHADESYRGSDLLFSNDETGETLAVSLKSVSVENADIIEAALLKYPEIPIMTTEEVANLYQGDSRIFNTGVSNKELHTITEENVDKLINGIDRNSAGEVVFNGQIISATVILWPFTIALLRNRITREQYTDAVVATLGQNGRILASRMVAAVTFGPIYAWYLLAMSVNGLIDIISMEKDNLPEQGAPQNRQGPHQHNTAPVTP